MDQPNPNQQQKDSDGGLHFLDYWRVIRARKEIILAVALLVVLVGTAYTFTLPRIYRSTATIKVNNEGTDVDVFRNEGGRSLYNPYFLRTQQRIISSRPVLYEVIERLNLRKVWGNEDRKIPEDVALNILRRSINLSAAPDTSLISIIAEREKPEEAARIANQVAEVYRDMRRDVKRKEMRNAIEELRTQLQKQQTKVDEAEQEMERIRQELDVTFVGNEQSGVSVDKMRLQQLEGDRIQARVEMLVRKARFEQMQALEGPELLNASEYVVKDPNLSDLRKQILDTDVSLSLMSENYGQNHPEVKRLRAAREELMGKLEEALDGLIKGLKADYEVARANYEALEKELAGIREEERQTQRESLLPFNKARRNLEIQRSILDALKARVTQEGITLEIPRTAVEVIEPAEPGSSPVSPNLFLNVLMSVFLGLGAGVGLAYFIEYLDTSIKTADDVERYLSLPVLGLVPQKVRPMIEEGPDSEHAEAYRVLRTNLTFTNEGQTKGTFLCTSGGAGEGKSTTIFNLAYICAQRGEKVLLIDSDLRRPVQHRILDTDNRFGLTNVLLRDVPVEETIKPTSVPNLHFLPSGRLPRTSLGLLESQRMKELIHNLRSKFDVIFLDSPPVIGISDASILASAVDRVIMVCQYRKYPRDMAMRAKQLLESSNARVSGVVLNNINVMRDDYYYYYHSYYYNYYYYRSGESAPQETETAEG
ncbi:GumC family protein [Kiritimatiella glycovorans]|uniref:non-specific protein-tyrosine kinase n=1 Tax=Kiritimatiella glycovorans TaxID=1307763 RepID=A0A0G3EFP6_9BACT|nr:polysaccharide biosynthesis tyrosine autokinase [Kiritimatiella glycovorans]AKJ65173.1 Tyrosine-protein kinase YwqD [Kiritimatiella glycovorans]